MNIIRHGDWSFAVRPCRNNVLGYLAWCKRGEITASGPMFESGDVRFEFADTPDPAIAKLMREVGVAS